MRLFIFISFLSILNFCDPQIVCSQWKQSEATGLHNGDVSCFATDGDKQFAGTWGDGVFLSGTSGSAWMQTNVSVASVDVNSLAVINHETDKEEIVAATNGGIYVSTNSGADWIQKNNGLSNAFVLSLAIVRGKNGTVSFFAGTWGGGVFRSTDGGQNWSSTSSGLTNGWVFSLGATRNLSETNQTTLYAGTKDGVFLSKDNGATWLVTSLSSHNIRAILVSGTMIMAGSQDGLFTSKDHSLTWFKTSLANKSVRAILSLGANIFVGTADGIYLSNNNGSTWSTISDGLSNLNVNALAVSKGYLIAGTWGGGIWRRPLSDF